MGKKESSPRDNARPTGNMSAEESLKYAQEFQKENFGAAINYGAGHEGDAAGTTQATIQNESGIPGQFDDRSEIENRPDKPSEHRIKNKPSEPDNT